MVRALGLLFVLCLACPGISIGRDASEQRRIDYLIQSLVSLKGAVFIRNGSEHDAQAARDHLRQKLAYGGDRIKTAEDFIKYCATQSSFSHKPYQIRMADGQVVDTSSFFYERLKEFDRTPH